jgi:micrococcal nuclease
MIQQRYENVHPNYIYSAVVTRVVDGDTLDVTLDLGFSIFHHARVRLAGIDTPESRTRRLKEKALGLAAKARLKELVKSAAPIGRHRKKVVYIQTSLDGKGKFGRILGSLWINNQNVNDMLQSQGHARPYYGGGKSELGPWTKRQGGIWVRWTASGYVPLD